MVVKAVHNRKFQVVVVVQWWDSGLRGASRDKSPEECRRRVIPCEKPTKNTLRSYTVFAYKTQGADPKFLIFSFKYSLKILS
ncbi:hypothetical protein L1987_11031 [Smallanthus sonchifolius]|uniref:Uncharacterized protein n=1 Tax=Smallanthus sonchifolius TaxID=185202 RepID=A0ACB9JD87_9ASTR|nr:hypothetical protein L1987_11031 [Smallanthus sonchifolius]